ncbi:hypothetical protein X925_01325 [Petrotoga sp. 9T1HF07.CasAA.8.2]|nr:hypothetical protein X925_01325 [Petrotoga sp. 9T1HF07.CasAA.8.2]
MLNKDLFPYGWLRGQEIFDLFLVGWGAGRRGANKDYAQLTKKRCQQLT